MAFWAPFLLLHLGGPDNITSYALEDNELWKRHWLQLIIQVCFTIYIFLKSFSKNDLWVPASLVLLAGMIKYGQRNIAFYRASFDQFGDDWVATGQKKITETLKQEDKSSVDSEEYGTGYSIPAQLKNKDQKDIFGTAVQLFGSLKRIFVGLLLKEEEQKQIMETAVKIEEVRSVDSDEFGTGHSIPTQFKNKDQKDILETAVQLFGCLKRIFVGPLLNEKEQKQIMKTLKIEERSSVDMLQIFDIELSLLYEALFTKFPVIVSNTGSWFRIANSVCILVALILFSLVKKKYQLECFDIILTYVLLIGALILDCLSHILLIKFSDWYAIAHFQNGHKFRNARRWSKAVSQLNFLAYQKNNCPVWLKRLEGFPVIGSLLVTIHNFRCQSSQNLEDSLWCFIWKELQGKIKWREDLENKEEEETEEEEKEVWFSKEEFRARIRLDGKQRKLIESFINDLDFTQNLLVWHIGTELCFYSSESDLEAADDRSKCKLLSDYMFYLAMVKPSMMAVALDDWKNKFKKTSENTRKLVPWISFWNEKTIIKKIEKEKNDKILCKAVELARVLKKQGGSYPWKEMSQVWVQLMFFAAIYCRHKVHAQQPSQGGELLTFVWLSINHLGLGIKSKTWGQQIRGPGPALEDIPMVLKTEGISDEPEPEVMIQEQLVDEERAQGPVPDLPQIPAIITVSGEVPIEERRDKGWFQRAAIGPPKDSASSSPAPHKEE